MEYCFLVPLDMVVQEEQVCFLRGFSFSFSFNFFVVVTCFLFSVFFKTIKLLLNMWQNIYQYVIYNSMVIYTT